MNILELIETKCVALAEVRAKLRKKDEGYKKALRAVDAEHNGDRRALLDQCGELRATLEALVEQARPDFLKPKQPKTRTFCGITVGFEKTRDSVTMPEEPVLVERIEKMLPASQGKTLLDRTVTIIKAAFKKLDQPTMQRLGCSVVSGTDKAVVRTSDDDIETLVQKSLGEPSATTTNS